MVIRPPLTSVGMKSDGADLVTPRRRPLRRDHAVFQGDADLVDIPELASEPATALHDESEHEPHGAPGTVIDRLRDVGLAACFINMYIHFIPFFAGRLRNAAGISLPAGNFSERGEKRDSNAANGDYPGCVPIPSNRRSGPVGMMIFRPIRMHSISPALHAR